MFHVIKKINRIFRDMLSTEDSSEIDAESFFLAFGQKSGIEKAQFVEKYLEKNYNNNGFRKVPEFPLNSEWINTVEPLSIYRDCKGKFVLLDFFTYCCINCMHVLPDLKTLENIFPVKRGLVVIGVHSAKFTNEKQSKNVAAAVKRYDIAHPVINDCEGTIWNSFDVHCWPTLVLIGPDAELLLVLQGEGHLELLKCFIDVALKYHQSSVSSHELPQITATEELTSFGILSFPGKITSYCSEDISLLAVSDTGHHRILVLSNSGLVKHTIGGIQAGFKDGDFHSARFNTPQGLAFKNSQVLYVADTENNAIREINLETQTVKTVVDTKQQDENNDENLSDHHTISSPWDVCFGKNQNKLIIAMAGYHQIWALYLADEDNVFGSGKQGEHKLLAGSGREENRNNRYPSSAAFAQPSGLTYCPERDSIFIADSESSAVRELNLQTGHVSAVVGGNRDPSNLFAFGDRDGASYDVKLQHPLGVAWSENRKCLYVADSYNHKLKVVDIFKNTCSAVELDTELNEPGGLCVLKDQVLIADTNNHSIKVYDPKSQSVSVLAVVDSTQKKDSFSVDEEIVCNKSGGKVEIILQLNKSKDTELTKDAPAFWKIKYTDGELNKLPLPEIRQDLKQKTEFLIDVPSFKEYVTINIVIEGVVYICKGELCSMKNMSFIVRVNYKDENNETVKLFLSHDI